MSQLGKQCSPLDFSSVLRNQSLIVIPLLNVSRAHPLFILTSVTFIQDPLISSAKLLPDLSNESLSLQSQIFSSQFPEVIISKHKSVHVILHLKSLEQITLTIR